MGQIIYVTVSCPECGHCFQVERYVHPDGFVEEP